MNVASLRWPPLFDLKRHSQLSICECLFGACGLHDGIKSSVIPLGGQGFRWLLLQERGRPYTRVYLINTSERSSHSVGSVKFKYGRMSE